MEARHARPSPTATRRSTETRESFRTSEFGLALLVIGGILISALLIKGGDTGGTDEFMARQGWLYAAIVVFGYCIGRGLAKAGEREP